MVKTVVINYDLKLKFKFLVGNYGFKIYFKIVVTFVLSHLQCIQVTSLFIDIIIYNAYFLIKLNKNIFISY